MVIFQMTTTFDELAKMANLPDCCQIVAGTITCSGNGVMLKVVSEKEFEPEEHNAKTFSEVGEAIRAQIAKYEKKKEESDE